jgi:hypothetical protein
VAFRGKVCVESNVVVRGLANRWVIGGLSDLAVDSNILPDPISKGFPPVIEELLNPCMKNGTDRACTALGTIPPLVSRL